MGVKIKPFKQIHQFYLVGGHKLYNFLSPYPTPSDVTNYKHKFGKDWPSSILEKEMVTHDDARRTQPIAIGQPSDSGDLKRRNLPVNETLEENVEGSIRCWTAMTRFYFKILGGIAGK